MSEVATYNSVFTEEYWGDILDLPEPARNMTPPVSVYKQMRGLTAAAAERIFTGDSRTKLPEGTRIDPAEEHPDLSPGTVVLLDCERLDIGPVHVTADDIVDDVKRPFYRQRFISNEGHLMAPASTLFRLNSRQSPLDPERRMVYPYSKDIPNTEAGANYTRAVKLAVYGVNHQGETIIKTIPMWEPVRKNGIRGQCGLREAIGGYTFQPIEVGQSLMNQAGDAIVRLRAADICLQGTLEYAKERKRVKRSALAGKLALSKVTVR